MSSSKKRKTPECENAEEEDDMTLRTAAAGANGAPLHDNDDDDDDDDDDEEDSSDDDLVLEGVVVRNHDVSDEDDDDDEDEDEEEDDEEDEDDLKNDVTATTDGITQQETTPSHNKRAVTTNGGGVEKSLPPPPPQQQPKNDKPKKKKKKRNDDNDDDVLNVDFTFCDMDEKYFHGIKSLLHSSSVFHQPHSSPLSDLMIENVAIGTVVSTAMEDAHEPDVFGFGSVLNIKTYQEHEVVQYIKHFCLQNCPATISTQQKQELELCWSGTTKRPVGLFLHGRMINMPLEIVLVLHEQLVADMDWAVQNANVDETPDERKAHDFGALIRLAPAERDSTMVVYKYFDDEIFLGRSEFHYVVDVTSSSGRSSTNQSSNSKQCIVVMVLTKTGHRLAMDDLKQLVHGR